MHLFNFTIFASAVLLFAVQPLIARFILPWFGGGSAVWTTAMLFFQLLLLAGYGYAHLSIRRLGPRAQAGLHLALLAAAVALLPITPAASWRPESVEQPTLRILLLLVANLGLPYFLLASTSPLMQAWLGYLRPGFVPYRLFALSNAGSLLALLGYPFLIEPSFGRVMQAEGWSAGFGLVALGAAACAVLVWRARNPIAQVSPQPSPVERRRRGAKRVGSGARVVRAGATRRRRRKRGDRRRKHVRPQETWRRPPSPSTRLLWLGLAAAPSILLLAATNQITQDAGSFPLLWVFCLSLYLLSFILTFAAERAYSRPVFIGALIPLMALELWMLHHGSKASILAQVATHAGALFVCCMTCHGELARAKPQTEHLTGFYLTLAGGGALGGIFVALVAPLVFTQYLELHLGLWSCCAFTLLALGADSRAGLHVGLAQMARPALALACGAFGLALLHHAMSSKATVLAESRSFYGVLRVSRLNEGTPEELVYLDNGTIIHGMQYARPERRREPTTYYSRDGGAGLVFRYIGGRSRNKIGVVGLGVGTLAAYGRSGDRIRFYEINPQVAELARTHFSFLSDSAAEVEVVLGDARLVLEREAPQGYDALFIDAFSSDAVPTHLLTREALQIYLRQLKPGGILALHTSNRHFRLERPLEPLAAQLGLEALEVSAPGSKWVVLTRNRRFVETKFVREATVRLASDERSLRAWTDDFTSLLQIVNL